MKVRLQKIRKRLFMVEGILLIAGSGITFAYESLRTANA